MTNRIFPKHPDAQMLGQSGAFNLNSGDRFIYHDGRTGWADEFGQDGDALVCWDNGTYGTAKWNLMSPEYQTELPVKNDLAVVCSLPGGFTLYRKENGAGGYTYISDQIGGGVVIMDTCLVDTTTLLIAMAEEAKRADAETRIKNAK